MKKTRKRKPDYWASKNYSNASWKNQSQTELERTKLEADSTTVLCGQRTFVIDFNVLKRELAATIFFGEDFDFVKVQLISTPQSNSFALDSRAYELSELSSIKVSLRGGFSGRFWRLFFNRWCDGSKASSSIHDPIGDARLVWVTNRELICSMQQQSHVAMSSKRRVMSGTPSTGTATDATRSKSSRTKAPRRSQELLWWLRGSTPTPQRLHSDSFLRERVL